MDGRYINNYLNLFFNKNISNTKENNIFKTFKSIQMYI